LANECATQLALPFIRPVGAFVFSDPSGPRVLGYAVSPASAERAMSATWDQDEAAAFVETLFAKHHSEIHVYLLRMVRDPELAADLTQDAFVKAYRNYDTLEKPDNARAWLYQIAHRVALDEIRRRKIIRFLPWTGESRGAAPSAEHTVMDMRLSGDLQRALDKIPERQRAALLLAELHDLTGLELAAALGVSHVAARALLTRARESLRQALAVERAADASADRGPRTDARVGQDR
jgi:RNA polymerase sigma-70 factor, ECF subfamily